MTESEWTRGGAIWPICLSLRDRMSDRRLRLLACAYCRSTWGLMSRASRSAIDLGERMADGPVAGAKRQAVLGAAIQAVLRFTSDGGEHFFAADRAYRVVCNDGWYAVEWTVGNGPELPDGIGILRDIVGDPFRPATFARTWLKPPVVALALEIYSERAFDRMESLGTALARSGCTDPVILDHCSVAGQHVRGCWVLDAILGKS